jgi:hypothetical protein
LRSRQAILVAAGTVGAMVACALPAQAAGGTGWRVSASINGPSDSTAMTTLAVVSARNAWALGFANTPTKVVAVIRHWNGSARAVVQPPAKIAAQWDAQSPFVTAAASRTSLLMFSTASDGSYLLRTGNRWRLGRLPGSNATHSDDITSAAISGPDDAWAMGIQTVLTSTGWRYGTYAAHFNGSRWTPVPVPLKRSATPPTVSFPAMSVVSRDDIWATSGSSVLRWTGGSAGFVKAAAQPSLAKGAVLTSIAATPGGGVWVAGAKGKTAFAARWNGSAWTVRDLPTSSRGFTIASLAAHGTGALWAVGVAGVAFGHSQRTATRIWRYAGGRWTGPLPLKLGTGRVFVFEVASVPHTNTTWAAGAIMTSVYRGIIAVDGPTPR